MLAHSAQREDAGVLVEWVVLEIGGHLIEANSAGCVTQRQHFHDFACGHSGSYRDYSAACGACHRVLTRINEPTGGIDLEHRHCAGDLRGHRYIQLKITAVIDELELLIVFGVGHSSLPTQTSYKIDARLIFSRSTVTDGLHCADIVQGIGERVRVEIVVKHDVAHIGDAEVAQRKLQHRIQPGAAASSITEQRCALEICAGISCVVAITDAISVIHIKLRCLLDAGFLLCPYPLRAIVPERRAF